MQHFGGLHSGLCQPRQARFEQRCCRLPDSVIERQEYRLLIEEFPEAGWLIL